MSTWRIQYRGAGSRGKERWGGGAEVRRREKGGERGERERHNTEAGDRTSSTEPLLGTQTGQPVHGRDSLCRKLTKRLFRESTIC